MNSLEQLLFILGGAAVGIAVGVVYLVRADKSSTLALRLSTAAYGPSIAALFVFVGFLWPEHYRFNAAGTRAYFWLQAVPALLLLLSLAKYPGSRRLHFVLVPVALLAWLWTFALGWVAVNGK